MSFAFQRVWGESRPRTLAPAGSRGAAPHDSALYEDDSMSAHQPNIAIIGAGLAGLAAAWRLGKAGLKATVYEASERVGGRVLSQPDFPSPGLVAELGAEFINSRHFDVLRLCREMGLTLVDRFDSPKNRLLRTEYFFQGRSFDVAEILEGIAPLWERAAGEQRELAGVADFPSHPLVQRLDRISVAEYLEGAGLDGWIRDLIDAVFTSEMGVDLEEQSSLNLVLTMAPESLDPLPFHGHSDERYRIAGGNQLLAQRLAERLDPPVALGHVLEAVETTDTGVGLDFQGTGGVLRVKADFAVLAVPLSMLRCLTLRAPLSPRQRRCIDHMGFGDTSKLLLAMTRRLWRDTGRSGYTYSDEPFQCFWDNTSFLDSSECGLTVFAGGRAGREIGQGSPEDQARRLLPPIDKVFPGQATHCSGKVLRRHWPDEPYILGGYAAWPPGSWTELEQLRPERPVGSLYFAGEHTSPEHQGFMNGAAESGRIAAEHILTRLGLPGGNPFPCIAPPCVF